MEAALLEPRAVADDRLLDAAYARRASQLWAYGRRLGLDSASAEDVMQEAFARAASVDRGSIRDLDAWLFRIVHNLAVDLGRRQIVARSSVQQPGSHEDWPVDDSVAVWAMVDRLPERQRAAIYLRFRADFDFATIAKVMGITQGGARATCTKALAALREQVAER